jgi:hypothetical protein
MNTRRSSSLCSLPGLDSVIARRKPRILSHQSHRFLARQPRVVGDELRGVLIGLGVEKSVEALEAAPKRPAVERPGGAALGQRRHVPFAHHVIAIGVGAQHFGKRPRLARDLAAIAG